MNKRLYDAIKKGYQVVYFDEYDGTDCLTYDVLKFLEENPNVTLVLDYTFFDIDTNKEISCHVVINQGILSGILNDDVKYYGAANFSGFVQYYNKLPLEIRNKNY